MKIFLDDIRETPDGWERCYWPNDMIELLKTENVSVISLDHDLGDDDRGKGSDVLNWILEQVIHNTGFVPPNIIIHTDNGSALSYMRRTTIRIHEIYEENKKEDK